MSDPLLENPDLSVYFFRKRLPDDTTLTCRVDLMPDMRSRRVGCVFTMELACGSRCVRETVEAPECSFSAAERIFHLLCVGNVHPEYLRTFVQAAGSATL